MFPLEVSHTDNHCFIVKMIIKINGVCSNFP